MKFNFNNLNPLFSADGNGGGGYDFTPEQFEGLELELDDAPVDEIEEVEQEEELNDQNSVDETLEDESGENTSDDLIDIPGIGKVSFDEIASWKSGHMMHADYTKKTQELAQQRGTLEQQIQQQLQQQYDEQYGHYKQLDDLFQNNPQLEQQFIELLNNQQVTPNRQPQTPQFDPTQHPMFQEMQQKVSQFEQMQQAWEQQQISQQIESEWNTLYAKYPDAKESKEDLAKFVDEYNESNKANIGLEAGYMLMNFNNVKKQTAQEIVKNNMKKKPANTVKAQNNASNQSDEKFVPEGNYENLVAYLMKKNLNL